MTHSGADPKVAGGGWWGLGDWGRAESQRYPQTEPPYGSLWGETPLPRKLNTFAYGSQFCSQFCTYTYRIWISVGLLYLGLQMPVAMHPPHLLRSWPTQNLCAACGESKKQFNGDDYNTRCKASGTALVKMWISVRNKRWRIDWYADGCGRNYNRTYRTTASL